MYGWGKNEELLGKVLSDPAKRSKVFLATKFGNMRGPNGEFLGINGKPEYVRQQCETSLKRLRVQQIDLYYQHRVDPNTPIEETVGEMAKLVKEGKVRFLGLSECSATTLRRAHKVHPIAAVQIEYSPWTLDIEQNGLLATARELGVTIVAYSPLGRGMLTGKYRSPDDFPEGDFRRFNPRFSPENFPHNLALVDEFQSLAQKKGCTASQLCLAWVLKQGEDIVAIPGTKRVKYLEENIGAAGVEISDEESKEIRAVISRIEIKGTRYPEAGMKSVGL
ncbi:aldo/keto reductase [Gloeophyllum trabeum ATCC 11539]|uniref:Aldo/keto reductase n=1 Tax=Gloeophyllum trabeum (strain ATCC 11539 / FP-39264 / Madison 617) TaxID=670483 RepID=S7R964_GLOTA|nr:aldo/keto reductase [Gloeophyllum trabeum ATCC 11539]EPQ50835.1 aldo/keto reductase [Gloeophyllum trabeum ATCC 11539]